MTPKERLQVQIDGMKQRRIMRACKTRFLGDYNFNYKNRKLRIVIANDFNLTSSDVSCLVNAAIKNHVPYVVRPLRGSLGFDS